MDFNDLIGHDPIQKTLMRIADSDEIPNVMLFCGPEGVGKHTFARAFIHGVFSRDGQSGASIKLQNNSHPDVKEYVPESKNAYYNVSQIDHFIAEIGFFPFEAKRRFFLFHDAHKLQTIHANRLLKTLEEMPSYAVAILFTSDEKLLLNTIASRAIKFHFFPLPEKDIVSILCQKNGFNEEKALQIAKFSEGSLIKALNSERLEELRRHVLDALGAFSQDQFDIGHQKLEEIEAFIEKQGEEQNGGKMRFFLAALDDILYWVRDLHLLYVSQDASLLYYPEKKALYEQLLKRKMISLNAIKKYQFDAIEAFELNIKPKTLLGQLLTRICLYRE
ncbi:MAG: hypothetical protein K9M07_06400 [Simkaniaceae bacterium]|nr:hypothetical protein [Simkaniaceae bacterium]MCF7852853.1 hypothetical protein [Simkaniaceae bacterium]